MRDHEIFDKAGMSSMGPQQTPMVLTEKCQEHNGNTIDTYCPVHQAVGCGTCIALKHGSCRGVVHIQKEAQGYKKTNEYKNIEPAIRSSLQQLKAFKTTLQTDLECLNKERDIALREIKDYRKCIEKELDRMERKITDEVHTKCKILQTDIKANMRSIEDSMSKLKSHLQHLESLKADNDAAIFVCVKDGNIRKVESDELLQNLIAVSQRETLKFKQNPAIDKCMKRIEKLGELHDEIGESSFQTLSKIQPAPALLLKQNKHIWASFRGSYNMNVKTDTKRCDIYGCTFLDDSMILITDHANTKLKRLTSSFQITDYCDLTSSPFSLCVTGSKEVAIAFPEEQKVQFVLVGKQLKLSRSFRTIEMCEGLAYSNENICISNSKSNEVHIYSKQGQCLRTIRVFISDLTSVYSRLTNIIFTNDHSKLIFSNQSNGIIIVNVKDGQTDCIRTKKLSAAQGVCVLENDNILVADYGSNEILQMTSDGNMLGAVVQNKKKGIKNPQSVCVDKANSRLIVTSYRNDEISVYRIIK